MHFSISFFSIALTLHVRKYYVIAQLTCQYFSHFCIHSPQAQHLCPYLNQEKTDCLGYWLNPGRNKSKHTSVSSVLRLKLRIGALSDTLTFDLCLPSLSVFFVPQVLTQDEICWITTVSHNAQSWLLSLALNSCFPHLKEIPWLRTHLKSRFCQLEHLN